jgi:endonuclease/exonuclease/phosphatase family metal-dependent hydrolase
MNSCRIYSLELKGSLLLCLLLPLLWAAQAQAACQPPPVTSLVPPAVNELLVATQNLWLFHDSHKDFRYDKPLPEAQVSARVEAIAHYVIHRLASPHLLALQEVENRKLLERLTQAIREEGGPSYDISFLPNHDVAGNAVALLSRAPVVVAQARALFQGLRVSGYGRKDLFARLPLLVALKAPIPMNVLIVHLRSAHGLDDADKRSYVLAKRHGQAQALIRWAREQKEPYLVLGDLNSGEGGVDFSQTWKLLLQAGWQEAEPESEADRYSYIYRCKSQQLDHIYLSGPLKPLLVRAAIAHGNAGHYRQLYASHGSRVVSDHDAVAVYLRWGQSRDSDP